MVILMRVSLGLEQAHPLVFWHLHHFYLISSFLYPSSSYLLSSRPASSVFGCRVPLCYILILRSRLAFHRTDTLFLQSC